MNISLHAEKEVANVGHFIKNLKDKKVGKATRRAINKTAISTRSIAMGEIRNQRKLKKADIKRRIAVFKARGNNLLTMRADLVFSNRPLPLIYFVVGSKKPRTVRKDSAPADSNQAKGKRRRSARPLKIEVVKGNRHAQPGIYIATAKHGRERYQIFRRSNPKVRAEGMIKQSASSLSTLLRSNKRIDQTIKSKAVAILVKNFRSEWAFEMTKSS